MSAPHPAGLDADQGTRPQSRYRHQRHRRAGGARTDDLTPPEEERGRTVMAGGRSAGCFVDTMQALTPAEGRAWRFYLSLHTTHWRAAREMFRRVCQGENHGTALLRFVADTGLDDTAVVVRLETALRDLAKEAKP